MRFYLKLSNKVTRIPFWLNQLFSLYVLATGFWVDVTWAEFHSISINSKPATDDSLNAQVQFDNEKGLGR
jgi:hypothetical protein